MLIAGRGIFCSVVRACPLPPCLPCFTGAWPNCIWTCAPNGEQVCCKRACCTNMCCEEKTCYNYGTHRCCNQENGHVCPVGTFCCGSNCCTAPSYYCCDQKACFDAEAGEHCCYYGTGKYCDNGIDCCSNDCCSAEKPKCCDGITCYNPNNEKCCDTSNGKVCNADESCCGAYNTTCYDPATYQCCEHEPYHFMDHVVCKKSCCDNWDCEWCQIFEVGYNQFIYECATCLHKADDYEELIECSNVVDDPDHTPTANGCGPENLPVDDNPTGCQDTSFLDACNAHDLCYGYCGSDRYSCDDAFWNAMKAVCEESTCALECFNHANEYYGVVHNWGEGSWENAQVESCVCCDC
jgi:hypothetical protein